MSRLRLGPMLLPLLLGACGEATDEPIARSSAPIYGGEASGSDDDAVVWVTKPGGICSGLLVAKNLVLTALHCVSDYNDTAADFTCSASGELENGGNGQGEMGPEHPPELIEVGSIPEEGLARGQQIFSTHTVTVCINDLALVVLDRELDLPIHPIELSAPPRFDDTMTVIGYGQTDSPDSFGRQRRSGVPVLDIGVPPRTFTLGPGGCKGDSGGPAINERTGAVAGVYSAYIGDCGSDQVRNLYTSISSFDELILNAFEAAGATPWRSGEPEPTPGEGAGGAGNESGGASSEAGSTGEGGSPDAPSGASRNTADSSGCSISFPRHTSDTHGLMTIGAVLGLWFCRGRRVARLVQMRRA
jgi:hypothetical protein